MPPRPLGRLVDPIARRAVGGKGAGLGALLLDWTEIVGPDVAGRCRPGKIGRARDGQRTLALVVRSGADAVDLQHRAGQILDRVNTYLGGQTVARLTLRQGVLPPAPRRRRRLGPAAPEQRAAVAARLAHLPDTPLKARLQSLGEAVLQREAEAAAARAAERAGAVGTAMGAASSPQSTATVPRKRSVPPL